MTGILLIDKSEGWTSNDVVQKLRGILHERRIGHAGTLDPMATGLLTVFVGRATRAVEFAEADSKRYRAALRLGLVTDTQDITGTVLRREEAEITQQVLERSLERFRGTIRQTPPMYSAVKINGERLYRLARRGETVARPERTVVIDRLELTGREKDAWILDVRCSKGTYIRTLCHDIGEDLGCGGCMSALRRTEAGCFTVEEAHTLEEVSRAAEAGNAEKLLLPTDTLFRHYPAATVDARGEKALRNGNPFPFSEHGRGNILRLYSESGEFLALGQMGDSECRGIKSFYEV